MHKQLQQQPEALPARLEKDGMQIGHSLADAPSQALSEVVPFHFEEPSFVGGSTGSIRLVCGSSGSGKSVILYGFAAFASKVKNWTVVQVDGAQAEGGNEQGLFAHWTKQVQAAEAGRLVVLLDETRFLSSRGFSQHLHDLCRLTLGKSGDLVFAVDDAQDFEEVRIAMAEDQAQSKLKVGRITRIEIDRRR